jgi:hypothetical protein
MSLIHNERIKLLATALDRASTACIVVGLLTPVVSGAIGATWYTIASIAIWLFIALVLHWAGNRILGRLKQ